MTDALQINRSTPEAGLGTFTYTVPAALAGLMTLEFKSFLPYQAAGSPAVTTQPTPEVVDITFAADTAGSRNNTYFTFNSSGDLYGFYVWFNINSAGTDPAVAGRTGIQVAGATGATAATLATAAIAAINASTAASPYVTASAGASGHAILTNDQYGDNTAAANGAGGSSAGATFSVTTTGAYGAPAVSGLTVQLKQNSTVLASYGLPSPTQPIMGGSVRIQAVAADVISIVLSSLSTADAALNAVKTIVNLYQGE